MKDELYLDDSNRYQNERTLDDLIKNEDEHRENKYVNYTIMKLMRLEDEAIKYMEQKYYKHAISGLIGKIHDIPE